MDKQRLEELNDLQQADTKDIIKTLIVDGTELVHTAGLLTEEIQELSQQDAITGSDLAEVAQYMADELLRYRRVLESVMVNQTAAKKDHNQIFVVERGDNVGIYIGETVNSGETIETSGRQPGQLVTTRTTLENLQKVAITAIAKDTPLRIYGADMKTVSNEIDAGTPIKDL